MPKPPVDIDQPLDEQRGPEGYPKDLPPNFSREHLHPGLQDNTLAPSHGLNAQSGVNAAAPAHPPKAGRPHRESVERKPVR